MPFNPTLDQRLNNLELRDTPRDRAYLAAYPIFAEFFRERVAIDHPHANDAKVAVQLVYTWMAPAELEPNTLDNWGNAAEAVSDARAARPTATAFDLIRAFVGGSLIATSKFLHLLDPGRYAIWDRRVAFAAYRYEHRYQYNTIDRYFEYLDDLEAWTMPAAALAIVIPMLGPNVSELRRKEFALFHLGIAEQNE